MDDNILKHVNPVSILECLTKAWNIGKARSTYTITIGAIFFISISALIFVLCYATTWPDGVMTSKAYYSFDDQESLAKASEETGLPEGYVLLVRTIPMWGKVLIISILALLIVGLHRWRLFCERLIKVEREDRKMDFENYLRIIRLEQQEPKDEQEQ